MSWQPGQGGTLVTAKVSAPSGSVAHLGLHSRRSSLVTCLLTPHNPVGPMASHLPGSTKTPERRQGFPESVRPLAGYSRSSGSVGDRHVADTVPAGCARGAPPSFHTWALETRESSTLTLLHPHVPCPLWLVWLPTGCSRYGGLLIWGGSRHGGSRYGGLLTQGGSQHGGS